jgi:hypothetical protein
LSETNEGSSRRRRYPALYERLEPIALAVIAVVAVALLLLSIAIALGLFQVA